MTVSQAKTWYSITFNLNLTSSLISGHEHILCSLVLQRSTKHISWPLWWWWWYELLSIRVRSYKISKFKSADWRVILQKLWIVVKTLQSPWLALHGSRAIPKQTAGTTRKIAPKILAPRGHKSLQYNQNYNQVFTLLMFQNKDLFNT